MDSKCQETYRVKAHLKSQGFFFFNCILSNLMIFPFISTNAFQFHIFVDIPID